MNTFKDIILNKLCATGFIYYPDMKRLMLKKENKNYSVVIVIELNQTCQIFFSQKKETEKEYSQHNSFAYNIEQILSHVEGIRESMRFAFA